MKHVLPSILCAFAAVSCRSWSASNPTDASGDVSATVVSAPEVAREPIVRIAVPPSAGGVSAPGASGASGSSANGRADGAPGSGPSGATPALTDRRGARPGVDAPPAADAVVSLVAHLPDEVRGERPFEYALVVENLGREPLDGVVVRERLGDGLSFVSSRPEPTQAAERELTFAIGRLEPAAPATITISALARGVADVTRTADVEVRVVESSSARVVTPGLAVSTAFDAPGFVLCDDVRGTCTVSNPGNGRTEGVIVHVDLPEGLTTGEGGRTIALDVGTLDAGESRPLAFAVRAQRAGAFSILARAGATGDLAAEAVPASVAVHEPNVTLELVGPGPEFTAGRAEPIRFRATNATAIAVTGARLVAYVPNVLVFEGADGGGVHDGERCTWNLGRLEAGETREVVARYRAGAPLATSVRAELVGDCVPQTRASCSVAVAGAVELSLRLSDEVGVARVGEPHEYTCRLVNQGQVELTDLRVAASWPTQTEWAGSGFEPEPFVAGERAEFVLGTLAPGAERTFTFRLRARTAGTFKINTLATSRETAQPVSQDERTVFVER